MKVYFINLDRSTDRLAWFLSRGRALGLDLVRVTAVDARGLDEAEMERMRALSSGNSELSAGEFACLLSHRLAWRLIAGNSDPWAFVAEDDIHFSADVAKFLESPRWIPAGTELIKAETNLRPQELSRKVWARPFGHELRQLLSNHYCSGGYFVSREGAARLLDFTDRHVEQADVILFSPEFGILREVPVLQIVPGLCLQDMYIEEARQDRRLASLIDAPRVSRRKSRSMSRAAKIRREARRVARQAAEPFRRAFLIATGRSVFRKVPFGGNRPV
ncbi:MAG: glycosyltransferase family 25 protein [Hyphomicrobiales bacterium]|nr:glycosyltransferase family 25 protein [Hyphomicrobiales bacterium]